MKRRKQQHQPIPSNLNTQTHSYEKRYTLKEVESRINWNSLKWLLICILVGWGAYQMGHVMGRNTLPLTSPPVANSSISN